MRRAFPLLLLALSSLPLLATDCYVATTGDDNASGTIDHPLKTLAAGIGKIGNGGTCWVRGGTYTLSAQLGIWGKDGASGSPRTLRAYPGEKPIVDGVNVTGSPASTIVLGSNWWVIDGIAVRNSSTSGIQGWGISHCIIRNCEIYDAHGAGIALWWNGSRDASDGNIIEDCHVHHVANDNAAHSANSWPGAVAMQNAKNGIIRRNHVHHVHGEGILTYLCDGITYADNVVHDTYATGLYLDNATNCVLERNLVYQTRDATYYPTNPPNGLRPHNGIQLANETYSSPNPLNGNIVRNNVVIGVRNGIYYGNYGSGGGMKNCQFLGNTFYDCEVSVVHLESSSGHAGNTFIGNIFRQLASHAMLDASGTITGMTFHHNAFFGSTRPTLMTGTGDVLTDPQLQAPGSYATADYKLTATSPCIDAGVALSALGADFFQTTRPRGAAPDIGMHEYVPSTTAPPAAPTGLAAAVISSSRIDLSWTDVATTETGYELQRSADGTTWPATGTSLAANATGTSVTGLAAGTRYWFRVRATNTGGSSAWATVDATTTVAPPAAPTGLTANVVSSTRIDLAWTDVATETGYEVQRSTDGTTWPATGTSLAANATGTSVTGLDAGTRYWFRVRATNAGGSSAWATVDATTSTGTATVIARINFQPASAPAFNGWSVDGGTTYGAHGALTYGWSQDITGLMRDRNAAASADQRYDTLAHMQRNGGATWEIAVANGDYQVRIVAGDASYTDSVYAITAEGTLVVSGTPSATTHWFDGTATVHVGDGRLTIASGTGATNNKICWIEIQSAPAAPVGPG